ncbi:hypothetical protein ABPG72_016422 [Tetrahymena utriculariae]
MQESFQDNNSSDVISCPYNPSHKIVKSRLTWHIQKCKSAQVNSNLFGHCRYNYLHILQKVDLPTHENIYCEDRPKESKKEDDYGDQAIYDEAFKKWKKQENKQKRKGNIKPVEEQKENNPDEQKQDYEIYHQKLQENQFSSSNVLSKSSFDVKNCDEDDGDQDRSRINASWLEQNDSKKVNQNSKIKTNKKIIDNSIKQNSDNSESNSSSYSDLNQDDNNNDDESDEDEEINDEDNIFNLSYEQKPNQNKSSNSSSNQDEDSDNSDSDDSSKKQQQNSKKYSSKSKQNKLNQQHKTPQPQKQSNNKKNREDPFDEFDNNNKDNSEDDSSESESDSDKSQIKLSQKCAESDHSEGEVEESMDAFLQKENTKSLKQGKNNISKQQKTSNKNQNAKKPSKDSSSSGQDNRNSSSSSSESDNSSDEESKEKSDQQKKKCQSGQYKNNNNLIQRKNHQSSDDFNSNNNQIDQSLNQGLDDALLQINQNDIKHSNMNDSSMNTDEFAQSFLDQQKKQKYKKKYIQVHNIPEGQRDTIEQLQNELINKNQADLNQNQIAIQQIRGSRGQRSNQLEKTPPRRNQLINKNNSNRNNDQRRNRENQSQDNQDRRNDQNGNQNQKQNRNNRKRN